ncbi:hypothetical protein LJC56_03505 [Christensenellaceae bacterium OttesenSCG-928-K19]|nr:hypothetical protein [Christensenellaceae bacterium OttesenSCG-928-K19]
MSCYYIIGLRLDNRTHNAAKLQEVLTGHGCNIKVRLGLHEASEEFCANDGLIMLQPCGEKEQIESLLAALNGLEGVKAKLIDLN